VEALKLLALTVTTNDQPTSSKALVFPEARLSTHRSFPESMSTTLRLVNTKVVTTAVNTPTVNTPTATSITLLSMLNLNLPLTLNQTHPHLLAESTLMPTISSNALSMISSLTPVTLTLSSTSTKCSTLTRTLFLLK